MKYKLQDLIDMQHFQNLQDRLNEIYSFPSAIIDNDGNILNATAWQDICTQFHRKNKDREKFCIQSDQYIQDHLHEANPAVTYLCPHGLVDNATPIIIDNHHYANFFTGQFFLEAPDMDFFKNQARTYGFEEDAYLEAVKKVPIHPPDSFRWFLANGYKRQTA
jgi:ligand-binding sensor protein